MIATWPDKAAALDWMDANQLGRRNLSPEQMSLLRGRIYNRSKKTVPNESGRNQYGEVGGQNVHQPKTAEALGERFGVSGKTVQRDGRFAESVESLKEHVPDIEARLQAVFFRPHVANARQPNKQKGPDFSEPSCLLCAYFFLLSFGVHP